MKHLKNISIGVLAGFSLLLTSCERNEITEVREITEVVEADPNILFERTLSFTTENNFSVIVNFPNGFNSKETDLVVGYIAKGIDQNNNIPLWDALPKTVFIDGNNVAAFNFNYSAGGIEVFLDTQDGLDKNTLPSILTTNRNFRFAILPSQLNRSGKILDSDLTYDKISNKARFIE